MQNVSEIPEYQQKAQVAIICLKESVLSVLRGAGQEPLGPTEISKQLKIHQKVECTSNPESDPWTTATVILIILEMLAAEGYVRRVPDNTRKWELTATVWRR